MPEVLDEEVIEVEHKTQPKASSGGFGNIPFIPTTGWADGKEEWHEHTDEFKLWRRKFGKGYIRSTPI